MTSWGTVAKYLSEEEKTAHPAMDYGATQVRELDETISWISCDVVLIATPVDLGRISTINQPAKSPVLLKSRGRWVTGM